MRLPLLPDASLVNEYGPSEACVWASAARLRPDDAERGVTIGRPIANSRLYVVDRALRPLPVGVTGELLIGGANLARGYFGKEDLTAAAFVPDPFAGDGGRLYRSGDRVRYREDGTVEFLGRVDDQLKVRGYRVEPGEIEAVLAGHPDAALTALLDDIEALDERAVLDELAAAGDG